MKNKLSAILICCLAIVLLLGAIPCSAESIANDTVVEAQGFLDGILAYQGTTDVQEWIDGYLTQNTGTGSEWYVIGLAQYGRYDFSSYETALLGYLESNTVGSASSRLKYALCLAAIGSTDEYICKTMNDSIGEQGLMSWVFGLHLMNNGYESERYSATDITAKLLELQCSDGGWAIMGQYGDVDSTAMTIQALAPYYETDTNIKAAVDRALGLLSEKQLDSGDYASYGVSNPESTSQVLVALSTLGIDAKNDEGFIKNGNDIFDGIGKYKLSNGGFCHKEGGEVNGTATVQTFYAMISYLRFCDEKAPLYILDNADPQNAKPAPSIPSDTDSNTDEPEKQPYDTDMDDNNKQPTEPKSNYKWWVSLIIIGVGGIVCVLLFVLKKRHVKNFIAVLLVCAVAVTVVCVTDFRSADDYYNEGGITKENAIGTVTLTIRCDTVAGRAEHIPENGIILDVTEFAIAEGDSVYTILTEAARKHKLQLENDGDGTYVYISGINYLYEFDYGDLSGWVYEVNGERPSVGAGEYKLKDGDVIEWHYTTNLGEDLK